MKNIKHLLAAALLASATTNLFAIITKKETSEATEKINFELYNKTDGNLAVSVSNVKEDYRGFNKVAFLVEPGDKFQTVIDITKPTDIKLWENVGDTDPKSGNQLYGSYSILRGTQDTIYVSFGRKEGKGDLKLYPQTGPRRGTTGKTESGLSLKNNVKPGQILEIKKYSTVIYWNPQGRKTGAQ